MVPLSLIYKHANIRIALQTVALFLLYSFSFPLRTVVKEYHMPSDIQDETSHDPAFNGDSGIGVTDPLNASTYTQTPLDTLENSHRLAHHASTTGKGMSMPLPEEGPTTRRARTRHPSVFGLSQQGAGSAGVPTGDFRAYAPSQPFEEAGPTSSVWHAYLDESRDCDANIVAEQRGEVNILLVFAGLFSAVVSSFITSSSTKFQPDYQKMSAFLLFDQINIQLALANGTSIDDVTTSGFDPNAPFTPDLGDVLVIVLLLTSLVLSLTTAFFAIVIDALYCDYMSPIPGQPNVRARIRHLRYNSLVKWNFQYSIRVLQVLLHFSLLTFVLGLIVSSWGYSPELNVVLVVILSLIFWIYLIVSGEALLYPERPLKTPLTHILSVLCKRPPITTVPGLASSLEVKDLSEVNKV
ncbi:hypothetical protein IW262DRAFT_1323774, partial [Armillaria fumosa]